MTGLLKISLPNYNIVTKSAKELLPISLIILMAGLLYGSYVLGTHATNSKKKEMVIAQLAIPTPTVKPTATPTPLPTNIPTPTVIYPSEKSLQVAAYLWLRMNSDQKAQIRNKEGGTTDTETINNWAISMDENPAKFAQNEAIMEAWQQAANTPVYIQNPQPQMPVHCTTSYIGEFANTNCN